MDVTGPHRSLDEALESLREEIARRRRLDVPEAGEQIHDSGAPGYESAIEAARVASLVGETPPPLARRGRTVRALGRHAARVVLGLSRGAREDQNAFNLASVDAMAEFGRALETARAEIREELADATERKIRPLQDLITAQAEEIDRLQRALGRPATLRKRLATETPSQQARFHPSRLRDQLGVDDTASTERARSYAEEFVESGRILDLACGNSAFLRACRDRGLEAYGVDLDGETAARAREAGLEIVEADVFSHLESTEDASLGGVFCAQFIEHLLPHELFDLIDLLSRKVRPGGRVVLETLNPECLQVLYRWFWIDPTHQRLVHPELLSMLLETSGFTSVENIYLPPPSGYARLPALPTGPDEDPGPRQEFDRAVHHLNQLLFSSTDYFVKAIR